MLRISLLIVLIFVICHTLKTVPSIFELFGKDPRVRYVDLEYNENRPRAMITTTINTLLNLISLGRRWLGALC